MATIAPFNTLKMDHAPRRILLPPFVLHNFTEWETFLLHGRGVFRIANRQKLDNADRLGDREDVLDLCFIECTYPARAQPFRNRAQREMVDRDGYVDRIAELTTGHHTSVGLGATREDHRRLTNKPLSIGGLAQSLSGGRITYHDESPFLPVACRRCQPSGLKQARNDIFGNVFTLKRPHALARVAIASYTFIQFLLLQNND